VRPRLVLKAGTRAVAGRTYDGGVRRRPGTVPRTQNPAK